MFATVDIDTGAPQKFVTLPQTAIAYNSYGDIVYLVEDKGKDANGKPQLVAQQTFVTTGATRGDQVAIVKGVKDGDTVVTAGPGQAAQRHAGADQQRRAAGQQPQSEACRLIMGPQ